MITTQDTDPLAALQARHDAILARLQRIEEAVEALNIPSALGLENTHPDETINCARACSVWRELREALDAG